MPEYVPYSHILIVHASQKASLLFRAESGMLCGMQQNAVVVFGDRANRKDSHTFIDAKAAATWLKDVYPELDLKEQGKEGLMVMLEERDGEHHGLYVPEDSLELPGFGPHISKRVS